MRIFDMCVFFVCPLVKLFFALYSRMPLRRSWTQSTTLTSLLALPLHSALLQSGTHTHTHTHKHTHTHTHALVHSTHTQKKLFISKQHTYRYKDSISSTAHSNSVQTILGTPPRG